ncbi:TnpV protein [Massilicoli timonensis]|uniref:TnpV protein n=1 Tax=Massilicoli timonensis TaxID=2015901 RepID=UPI003CCB8E9F
MVLSKSNNLHVVKTLYLCGFAHLKEYQRLTCTNLLTRGKLNTYLADIDREAQERFETLTEQMKQYVV